MVFGEHVSASENLEHDCLVTQESLADNNCPAHSEACATGEAIHEAKTRIASLYSKVIHSRSPRRPAVFRKGTSTVGSNLQLLPPQGQMCMDTGTTCAHWWWWFRDHKFFSQVRYCSIPKPGRSCELTVFRLQLSCRLASQDGVAQSDVQRTRTLSALWLRLKG